MYFLCVTSYSCAEVEAGERGEMESGEEREDLGGRLAT